MIDLLWRYLARTLNLVQHCILALQGTWKDVPV
jgi:hypothetical protein